MPFNEKCTGCKNEIPVGKYYELYKEDIKVEVFCSPCWGKEQVKYEDDIKKELLSLTKRERANQHKRMHFSQINKRKFFSFFFAFISKGIQLR